MYVLLKTGKNAGQIVDIRHDQAKVMIADGRATDARETEQAVTPPKPSKPRRGAR